MEELLIVQKSGCGEARPCLFLLIVPSHLLPLSSLCGWNPGPLWMQKPRLAAPGCEPRPKGVNPTPMCLAFWKRCVVSAFPGKTVVSFPLVVISDLVQSPAGHLEGNASYSLEAVIPTFSSMCWLPCTWWAFALLNCLCLEVQESVWAEQATITPLEKCSSPQFSFSIQVAGKLNFIPSKLTFPPLNKAF